LAVDDIQKFKSRYERYLGTRSSAVEGGVRFALPNGSLLLLDPEALSQQFPGLKPPLLPFPAAIVVSVTSLRRTEEVLACNAIDSSRSQYGVHISPDVAGNVALTFKEISQKD